MASRENLFKLRARLGEVLGTEEAGIMMELFPPTSWDDLATRSGLDLVRAELGADMANLRTELQTDMANLRTELQTDMANLRTELRTDMANLRSDVSTQLNGVRAEMASLSTELRGEIAALQVGQIKLEAGLARLETGQNQLELGYARLDANVKALQAELRSEVSRLERTIRNGLAANTATMVAIAAVVVAAVRL